MNKPVTAGEFRTAARAAETGQPVFTLKDHLAERRRQDEALAAAAKASAGELGEAVLVETQSMAAYQAMAEALDRELDEEMARHAAAIAAIAERRRAALSNHELAWGEGQRRLRRVGLGLGGWA
jgi:3-oxoacyl-ACP reductase-like protein